MSPAQPPRKRHHLINSSGVAPVNGCENKLPLQHKPLVVRPPNSSSLNYFSLCGQRQSTMPNTLLSNCIMPALLPSGTLESTLQSRLRQGDFKLPKQSQSLIMKAGINYALGRQWTLRPEPQPFQLFFSSFHCVNSPRPVVDLQQFTSLVTAKYAPCPRQLKFWSSHN